MVTRVISIYLETVSAGLKINDAAFRMDLAIASGYILMLPFSGKDRPEKPAYIGCFGSSARSF